MPLAPATSRVRGGRASTDSSRGNVKSSPIAARRRSRRLALQGLYEWAVGRGETSAVLAHMHEQPDYAQCDQAHFDSLLRGCIDRCAEIDAVLERHVDRRIALLSPVELAALRIGVYELMFCLETPYRVVINEAIELAKSFGGTDGHRFVNGVIDRAAAELREREDGDVAARGQRRRS